MIIISVRNKINASIEANLIAGRGKEPFICFIAYSPYKEVKQLKKWLSASKDWRVYRDTIWTSGGIHFNGIASWGMDVAAFLNGYEHRFRVLQIDRLGQRFYYAIPVSAVDTFSSLPHIELNVNEVWLIRAMANELSTKGPVGEAPLYILHPAKPTLIENREQWAQLDVGKSNFSELLQLMKDNRSLCHIVTAALATQYRCFLPGEDLPEGIYNFVIPQKGGDVDLWFYDVLRALTFTNDHGKNMAGPITITMKEADDLKRWMSCNERLAVIRTTTGALLWPLLEEIEKSDQFLRSGGAVSHPLPTVPISLTRAYLHHTQAIDIELPSKPPSITAGQQDLLRSAMSRLLWPRFAKNALYAWREKRAQPTAYRTNGFQDWNDVLMETCLRILFSGDEYKADRELILTDTQRRREEQGRAIEEALRCGIELLTDPSKYSDEIIERPPSRAAWGEAVEKGTLAFWYTPKKGDYKGITHLVFISETLKKLIARVGCTEDLYDSFIGKCENNQLINNNITSIRLGDSGTITAIPFLIEKP